MSCFVVSNNHISAIIGWACRENISAGWINGCYAYRPGAEQEATDILYAANIQSHNARYQLDESTFDCVYNPTAIQLKRIEVIKACDCLAYQCDEWEGFEGSKAQAILRDIKQSAIYKLPGYDAAPWSIV
jgi:hypothetical protein